MDTTWDDYVWVVVLGALLACFTAYGIGANDVANAFATSVGAKTITLMQAVLIASIFEFAGAVFLGAHVTDIVRNKIADSEAFKDDPEVLMYGMLCVLAATGIWLTLASFLELPVSTTHSVVGGIIGMAMAFKGADAVIWFKYEPDKGDLDFFEGVAPVIVSWIISPLLSGGCAAILFFGIRTLILRREASEQKAFMFFPALVGLTVATNVYFVIYKGFRRKFEYDGDKQKVKNILGHWVHLLAWGTALLSVGTVAWKVVPYLKKKIEKNRQVRMGDLQAPEEDIHQDKDEATTTERRKRRWKLLAFFDHDVHGVIDRDQTVHDIYETGEVFDHDTEEVFKYLQILTAMCDSFEHGANDVANAIAPFASIYMIYKRQSVENTADVPEWILVLGGAGIVVGLATYGYNIIRAIGVKLIKVTASRGFSIELGAAMVITLGSHYGIPILGVLLIEKRLGIPLSTTHCQVGATVGVGLLEGKRGVNLWLLAKVISGWMITFVVAGITAAMLFAQGAYTPSVVNLRTINRFEAGLIDISHILGKEICMDVNKTNHEIWTYKNDDSIRQLAFVRSLVDQFIKNETMEC